MADGEKVRRLITLAGLLFSLFLAALDFSIITTAIPSIAHQLQSQTAYIWTGSAYLLTSAAVAPVWGTVADIRGRKPALLISIILFAVGSAICGWSQSFAQLIVGRSVQGCAAGGIIVLVNVSISQMWSARHRSMFLASTGLVWAIAAGLGPLLGGYFSEYSTWRWIFWINLPLSFAAFVALSMSMRPREAVVGTSQTRRMDWIGSLLIVSLTVMVLCGLDFGGVVSPWSSPKVVSLLVGGFVLLISFVLWELKGASDPLIPTQLLDRSVKVSPLLVCFAHGFVNMSSWYFLPLYFQAVRGVSPTRSGVLIMPIVVTQAVTGLAAGAVIFRFGWIRPVIWVGMTLATVGFGLFISIGTSTPLSSIVLIEIAAALGIGATFQAPLIAYQSAITSAETIIGTALFGLIRSLSTSISVVLGGVVFQNGMSKQSKHLAHILGEQLAQNFTAPNAASNVLDIGKLPLELQMDVRKAYASSLHYMWIMYASVGALGLAASFLVAEGTVPMRTEEEPAAAESVELPARLG